MRAVKHDGREAKGYGSNAAEIYRFDTFAGQGRQGRAGL